MFVVVTGGPGAGKTSLIDRLRSAGHATVGEAGRQIIQDQLAIGGPALHTADAALFAEIMLAWEIRSYREAGRHGGTVFFDRGIPDLVGYHALLGRPVPPHFTAAAGLFRYHRLVFIAPPWRAIYANDAQRGQDFDEAVRSYQHLVDAYTAHGYDLVQLPQTDVAGRAAFVRSRLAGGS